jgi:hypothetical protein
MLNTYNTKANFKNIVSMPKQRNISQTLTNRFNSTGGGDYDIDKLAKADVQLAQVAKSKRQLVSLKTSLMRPNSKDMFAAKSEHVIATEHQLGNRPLDNQIFSINLNRFKRLPNDLTKEKNIKQVLKLPAMHFKNFRSLSVIGATVTGPGGAETDQLDIVLARKQPEDGEEDERLSLDHDIAHGDDGETMTIQGHVASLSDVNHYLTVEQAAADADGGFQTLTLTGRGSQQDLRLLTDGHQPLVSEPTEHDQLDHRSSPRASRQQNGPASKAPPKN